MKGNHRSALQRVDPDGKEQNIDLDTGRDIDWSDSCWLYRSVVIHLFSRKIVGWACSKSPDSELTKKALRMAYESRGKHKGVLFHSDQGSHYASKTYRQLLGRYGMHQSLSRRGNCWDNAPISAEQKYQKTYNALASFS